MSRHPHLLDKYLRHREPSSLTVISTVNFTVYKCHRYLLLNEIKCYSGEATMMDLVVISTVNFTVYKCHRYLLLNEIKCYSGEATMMDLV